MSDIIPFIRPLQRGNAISKKNGSGHCNSETNQNDSEFRRKSSNREEQMTSSSVSSTPTCLVCQSAANSTKGERDQRRDGTVRGHQRRLNHDESFARCAWDTFEETGSSKGGGTIRWEAKSVHNRFRGCSHSVRSWHSGSIALLCLSFLSHLNLIPPSNLIVSAQITGIGGVVDEVECYTDLYDSDADGDRGVDKTEFITFLNLQSDDYFLFAGDDFDALPDEIQQVFEDKGLCDDGSKDCSVDEKQISTEGTGPRENPNSDQVRYLYDVCHIAFDAIQDVVTEPPTVAPTPVPTPVPTPTPTSIPTKTPTASPTSETIIILRPPDDDETIQNESPQTPTDFPKITPLTTSIEPGLETGAVIGIAAAAFVAGFIAIAGLYTFKNKSRKKDEAEIYNGSDKGGSKPRSAILGASTPHYGPGVGRGKTVPVGFSSLSDDGASENGSISKDSMNDIESQASSSQAGSSGWSSSAGVSSLNTASVDSMDNDKVYGSSLAAIGVASGVTSRLAGQNNANSIQFMPIQRNNANNVDFDAMSDPSDLLMNGGVGYESGSVPNLPDVSRADLDQAIEAGDWAAVGATAALLASASDSVSTRSFSSGLSKSTSRSSRSGLSSIDAARAAELDHLVDTGDWEGVVLAAQRFEANTDHDMDEGSKSLSSEGLGLSSTLSDPTKSTDRSINTSGTSVYSPSTKSALSASPSTEQKREEIRSEVEALVRRVVPDEIDNVDEMMLQFRGREEELVETLRTMQERSIAQRARAAVHKSAKREARRARKEKMADGSSGLGFPPRPPPPSSESSGTSRIIGGIGIAGRAFQERQQQSQRLQQQSQRQQRQEEEKHVDNNNGLQQYMAAHTTAPSSSSGLTDKEISLRQSTESGTNYNGKHLKQPPTLSSLSGDDEFSEPRFENVEQGAQDSKENQDKVSVESLNGSGSGSASGSGSFSGLKGIAGAISSVLGSNKNTSRQERPPLVSNNKKENSRKPITKPSSGKENDNVQIALRPNRIRSRTALELAIEAGDWEAVGEAAAMMSDASVTTASTGELRGIAEGEWESTGYESTGTGSSSYRSCTSVNAERATELDRMIDKGDWTGVVAAASRFSSMDARTPPTKRKDDGDSLESSENRKAKDSESDKNSGGSKPSTRKAVVSSKASLDSDSVSFESLRPKDKALREEQDALAQAEIWWAIAAQSKQEASAEAKGASDAADWAISRSLLSLNAGGGASRILTGQEEKGEVRKNTLSVSSVSSSKGDKSV